MRETTLLKEFESNGWLLTPACDLTGEEIADCIRLTAERLASMNAYLGRTDHLSDAELYAFLDETIREFPLPVWPTEQDEPPVSIAVPSDDDDWLRYYADDDARNWHNRFFRSDAPAKELPPFPRSHWMPQNPMSDVVWGWDEAPLTSLVSELAKIGWQPRKPSEVEDDELKAEILMFAGQIAKLRVFCYNTDHLSDREFYEALYEMAHEDDFKVFPFDLDAACSYDFADNGSDDEVYLRYYADDDWRDEHLREYPDRDIPPAELPPYPRDHLLPRREAADPLCDA